MESTDKDRLIVELKDSVDSQVRLLNIPSAREDVRRDCAMQILDALVAFLKAWEHATDFPSGVVRDAFQTLLAEVGPGDAQVRATLVETIPSLATTESRQAVLDVMPWCMPVEPKELEQATQQVLDTLRQVLLEDSEALLPVLGCLSLLPLSTKGRAEAWNVALASLPVVSETDLPVLARTLLCNVTNSEDASHALQALRTEFELLQSTFSNDDDDEDPIPLISHVLLGAFQDRENRAFIAKAYPEILKTVSTAEASGSAEEAGSTFLVLDAVAVLALYQNPEVKSDVETMMDAWIEKNTFPFATFRLLLKTMCRCHRPGEPGSVLYNRLVPVLLSLGMFLLLAPVRIGGTGDHQRNETHQFLIEFHHNLDRDYQEELVQCLLHLSQETSWDPDETVGKKRRVRSRKELEKSSKREGLKSTADVVHAILQELARTARGSVARFKHVLVERLTAVPNDSTLDDHKSTEQLCGILSCLVEPTIAEAGSGVGIDASEIMILLQKLLFTASYSADRRSTGGESTLDVSRVIRGLILSTELIKSEALSRSEKECIHQWVHRILLPTTRRTVDPEIGSHGLRFLSAWSSWQQSASHDSTVNQNAESEQMYDMFQSFKMILANTGLIQMLSLYLERRRRPNEVVLGYTSIPSPFLTYSNPSGKRKKRDMIFCIHSYVRSSNVKHPSRWGEMTTWVYDLVDTYLTMGREGISTDSTKHKGRARTKWLPDGWLEASLELPSLNLVIGKTGNKTKRATDLLSSQLCNHEITFDTVEISKSAWTELANALCEHNDIDQVIRQVENVLRVTLSFVLGIGLSAAVLRNTHAHLLSLDDMSEDSESMAQEDDSRRRHEIVKLMQYQVMKLYDLKRKSETCARFLEALAATVGRLHLRGKRSNGAEAVVQKASKIISTSETACEQTRRVLSKTFFSADFVDPEILLKCLVDTKDEAVLVEGLKGPSDTKNQLQFKMIVELRRGLLDHLSAVYLTSAVHNVPTDDHAAGSVASLIDTASTVSRMLPAFRKAVGRRKDEKERHESLVSDDDELDAITAVDVSRLSSSYFRLVKKILIKATRQANAARSSIQPEENLPSEVTARNGDHAIPGSSALLDLFVQCVVNLNATGSSPTKKQGGSCISLAFNRFLDHLRMCEDEATALELIDILSILSLKEPELVSRALEACWRVLHTVYTISSRGESKGDELPRAFQVALDPQDRTQQVGRVLQATIVKTATSDAKHAQCSSVLRRGILLLWGLTVQSPSAAGQYSHHYLSKLTTELVQFLDAKNGSVSSMATSGGVDERSQRLERRAKRHRPYVSAIPSLTMGSFSTLFELLLHATVAGFAMSAHAHKGRAEEARSPFQHHHDMVQLVSRLLDVYVTRFHLFPRRMLSVVIGACKHMLNVCIFQVESCVQWRNAQPILSVEQKRAGVHDYGSIKFLEQLLQTFVTWGAGKVMAVCGSIRQLSRPTAETGADEDEELLLSLSQNDKRFTSLMMSGQKTIDALRDVASAHNLVPPKFDSSSLEKLPVERVTTRSPAVYDEDKGYHDLGWQDERLEAANNGDGVQQKKRRRRVAPTLVSVQTEETSNSDSHKTHKRRHPVIEEEDELHSVANREDSPAFDDDASQKSSDAFGVSGKWGDDDDEAEEESSSGSLELEVSNIFRSA